MDENYYGIYEDCPGILNQKFRGIIFSNGREEVKHWLNHPGSDPIMLLYKYTISSEELQNKTYKISSYQNLSEIEKKLSQINGLIKVDLNDFK